jgi:hypothetical protein
MSMAQYDHWMPLNVGDYLADTMHLNTFQHGVYIRLIMHYWKRRDLPCDLESLAQIAGTTARRMARWAGPVLLLFSDEAGRPADIRRLRAVAKPAPKNERIESPFGDSIGRFFHRRLDAELLRAQELSGIRQSLGKQGAKARWGKQGNGHDGATNGETINGNSHPFANATRARATPTTTDTTKNPPVGPPKGGRRARGDRTGGEGSKPKNGFITLAREMLAEQQDADDDRVVPRHLRLIQ